MKKQAGIWCLEKKMTKTLYEIISERVEEERINGGFAEEISVREFSEKPRFKAYTFFPAKRTDIFYNPDYNEKHTGRIIPVARDIARHEINHHGYMGFVGCPRTVERHAKSFIEPIAEILDSQGFGLEDIKYLSNALQDTILHGDLNNGGFSLDGISYFFEEIGENCEKDKNNGKRKFTPFYEAHVKLNMYLWGNKRQRKELAKYFINDKEEQRKISEVIQNFLKRTGISDLKQEDYLYKRKIGIKDENGEVAERIESSVKDRKGIANFITNESNWETISRIYAEEFSKLMKPGYALPILNHSGKNTRGHSRKHIKGSSLEDFFGEEEFDSDNEDGNYFDKKMQTRSFKRARIEEANKKSEEVPKWMNSFESMDLLLESMAKKLEIIAASYTEQESMPVVHYGKRDFDPEKDDLRHVSFGFDDKGNPVLKKKRFHVDIPLSIKRNEKGFPEMRFGLLDTSGSMKYNIRNESDNSGNPKNIGSTKIFPWGDKSKYHYALLSWYGFLEYLRQNNLLSQTSISLGNFSDETSVGKGLTEAKKRALSPQFGETKIDMSKISSFLEGRDNLIFTISDGGISNWDSIKKEFIEKAKNHHYFHLQIGASDKATRDLEKAGVRVEYVESAEDLARKTIDLTDKIFRQTN